VLEEAGHDQAAGDVDEDEFIDAELARGEPD
jgi:hypothetical protein